MKRKAAVVSILLYGCTTWTLTKRLERMDGNYTRMFIKQVLATTPHETPTIRTLAPHHKNYTSSTNQTRRTLLEKQGRAHKRCTPVDPHSWMCKSGTTSTNLHTAAMWGHGFVILKTCRRRWMIGRNGERRSGISAQAARHDDDDDDT